MSKANNKVFHFWSVKKIGTADLAVIMGKKDWIEFIDSGRSVLGELNRPSNSVEGLFRNLGFKIDTSTINRAKNMGRLDLKHVKANNSKIAQKAAWKYSNIFYNRCRNIAI